MCAFINVSRPFQASLGLGEQQAAASHYPLAFWHALKILDNSLLGDILENVTQENNTQ
jgi:hypothetical protein